MSLSIIKSNLCLNSSVWKLGDTEHQPSQYTTVATKIVSGLPQFNKIIINFTIGSLTMIKKCIIQFPGLQRILLTSLYQSSSLFAASNATLKPQKLRGRTLTAFVGNNRLKRTMLCSDNSPSLREIIIFNLKKTLMRIF